MQHTCLYMLYNRVHRGRREEGVHRAPAAALLGAGLEQRRASVGLAPRVRTVAVLVSAHAKDDITGCRRVTST